MKSLVLVAATFSACLVSAAAMAEPVAPVAFGDNIAEVRLDSLNTRESVATTIFAEGLASIGVGALMTIPDDYDQGVRYGGINTAAFGVVNVIVGAFAMNGITKERERWRKLQESEASSEVRLQYALSDERRESVGHAVNLGLGAAYAGIGALAIVVSQLNVEHPNRWLGSGIAIESQAAFLIVADFVGMSRSADFHNELSMMVVPTVAIENEKPVPMVAMKGGF